MRTIPLSNSGYEAIVDDEDYERLTVHRWQPYHGRHGAIYAIRQIKDGGRFRSVWMHRDVLGLGFDDPEEVDHRDRDGLRNIRSNLRIVTRQQNTHNRGPNRESSSKYKGVWWEAVIGKWRAEIRKGRTRRKLGSFVSEEDAAKAYDLAAKELFGEYAYLNFPETQVM